MSKPKWAVLESGTAWVVVHPGDVFRGSDGLLDCWDVHSRQHTWEEAMQEANRMARTTTVTLPTPQAEHTIPAAEPVELPIHVRTEGQRTEISAAEGPMRIILHHDELEPVALVLLAHSRKETI